MSRKVAFSINFDSLNEAYGFPDGYTDPCFSVVADRFFELAEEFGITYTIYVIGKDLENPIHAEAVRRWHAAGHEIANHTYSHPMNLGALSLEQIREEVLRAHRNIEAATGTAPTGFIAPAWSSSKNLYRVLSELGYEHDSSIFPSYFLYPMAGRIALNHLGSDKFMRALSRKDYFWPTRLKRRPFQYPAENRDGGLVALPLPTDSWNRPCWHSIGFILGWNAHFRILEQCLKKSDGFYYVLHPTDLLDARDLDQRYKHHLIRAEVPLQEKTDRLRQCFERICASGRECVPMSELAKCEI